MSENMKILNKSDVLVYEMKSHKSESVDLQEMKVPYQSMTIWMCPDFIPTKNSSNQVINVNET